MNNLNTYKNNLGLYKRFYENALNVVYEEEINSKNLLDLCPLAKKSVLELGCGLGNFTRRLIDKYSYVYVHEGFLDIVRQANLDLDKVSIKIVDLEREFPSFNQKFDLIVAKLVLMYISNLDGLAKNISDNLLTNGHFVFSITHPLVFYKRSQKAIPGDIKDYFDEGMFVTNIGTADPLVFNFFHRTFQTYINLFSKYGLYIEEVSEPKIPLDFVAKYPKYLNKVDIPLRLNIRFIKKI